MREKYEDKLVEAALLRHALVLDGAPAGKRIEAVIVDAAKVILPGDFPLSSKIPWTWLNLAHVRTREPVIERELLFRVGDRYRQDLIDESGRNLRKLFILSVARLVAARGATADTVRVLVVTKDQWSLRLNTEFTLDQARLDYLSFSITEHNLAGRNKSIEIDYALDPGRHTVGLGYIDPRLVGSRVALSLLGGLYVDRARGRPEGGYAQIIVGQPLYSLRTEWGWEARLLFIDDKVRLFRGGEINQLELGGGERAPEIYARRRVQGILSLIRSFGVERKANLTFGLRWDAARYQPADEFPAEISRAGREAFVALLPRSEEASGPFVALQAFGASFIRRRDIDTFALSEDFRVGPGLTLEARYAEPLFGLPSRFLELTGSYSHLHRLGENLLSYSARFAVRLQEGVPGAPLVNQEVFTELRNVSPRFGPFRLHVAGKLRLRAHDLAGLRLTLGSDSGLRGFGPRALRGNNLWLVNLELRTIALNLWTIHVGGVLFYDAGDAPADLTRIALHHDAGLGLRVLLPQFNRSVLRFDLAFPIEAIAGGWLPRFSAEFGQAF